MDKTRAATTQQCWLHYASSLPKDPAHVMSAWEPVANATNVTIISAKRWARGTQSARGPELIYLRYFLEGQGYRVKELEALNRDLYRLGRIISKHALTFDEAAALLGYKSVDSLYLVLKGKGGMEPKRQAVLRKLIEEQGDQVTVAPTPEKESDLAAVSRKQTRGIAVDLLEVSAHLFVALYPLVVKFTSEGATAEDRKALRTLIGQERLFDFSTRVNSLCGESAFKHYSSDRATTKRRTEQS